MDDNSDSEIETREEILKRYYSNPMVKKYEKYYQNIESYLIDIGEKSIDEVLNETIVTFFELKLKLDSSKLYQIINKLSMLYNKLKQMSFFNLMITYCHFLKKISTDIDNDRNATFFNPRQDIISTAIYDKELNKNLNHKIFRLIISVTSSEKYEYLKKNRKICL